MVLLTRKIALYLALLLTVGHGFVPHDHAADAPNVLCAEGHDKHHSFADIIACLYHADLGEDHLEHYPGPPEADVLFALPASTIPVPQSPPIAVGNAPDSQPLVSAHRHKVALRGPPRV